MRWTGAIFFLSAWTAAMSACGSGPITRNVDGAADRGGSADGAREGGLDGASESATADALLDSAPADGSKPDVGPTPSDGSPSTDGPLGGDRPGTDGVAGLDSAAVLDGAAVDVAVDAAVDAATNPQDAARDMAVDMRMCFPLIGPDSCAGRCTTFATDVLNCGSCGNACPLRPNADASCVAGKCVSTCRASWFDCKTVDIADGCETRIDTPDNCGMCGREACPASGFVGTCVNGKPVCTTGICKPGYGNCDPASNACETAWASSSSSVAPACFPALGGAKVGAVTADFVEPLFAAMGPDGVTYAAGMARGMLDLDPTDGIDLRMLPNGGLYLLKLGADGVYAWGRIMTSSSSSAVTLAGLAIGTDGSVALAGSFLGSLDLDPGDVEDRRTSMGGDLFVTKVSAAGTLAWSKVFPAAEGAGASTALAPGPDGGFVLLGSFIGPIDLDPGPATDRHSSPRVQVPFLVALAGDGTRRWVSSFEQNGDICGGFSLGSSLVATPDGGFVIPGNFYGDCDFAPGTRVERRPSATGDSAMLVLKLDAAGAYANMRLLRSPMGSAMITDVAVTSDGSMYAGGSFQGTFDFDEGTPVVAREGDARSSGFLMKLTAELAVSWVSDGMADLQIRELEPAPDNGVLGIFIQEDGTQSLTKLDGNHQPSWTMPFGGPGTQTEIADLAAGGGGFVVVGRDSGGNDLDPGPGVSRTAAGAGFLARFRF